jgi:hypothetical protein
MEKLIKAKLVQIKAEAFLLRIRSEIQPIHGAETAYPSNNNETEPAALRRSTLYTNII